MSSNPLSTTRSRVFWPSALSVNSTSRELPLRASTPLGWIRRVAEQRGRIVAAAYLLRYGADDSVGESYRDSAAIRWFLFWPEAPY